MIRTGERGAGAHGTKKFGESGGEWLLRQRFAIEGDREQARGGPDAQGPVAIPVRAGNSSSESMGTAFCKMAPQLIVARRPPSLDTCSLARRAKELELNCPKSWRQC